MPASEARKRKRAAAAAASSSTTAASAPFTNAPTAPALEQQMRRPPPSWTVSQLDVAPALRVLRSSPEFKTGGQRADASLAPTSSLQAKFEALRNKLEKGAFRKGGKFHGRRGDRGSESRRAASSALTVVDPMLGSGAAASIGSTANSGGGTVVIVTRLLASSSSSQSGRLVVALGRCAAHFVLAPLKIVEQSSALRSALAQSSAAVDVGRFFVVPAAPRDDGAVWFCGGTAFEASSVLHEHAVRALIDAAVAEKREGRPFCKVAKAYGRLASLVAGASSEERLGHLFSRTAPSLRASLQMDDTASFSVTDEVSADAMTSLVLRVPGVDPRATAVLDATACVGGNALSFAKRFSTVVAIESDTTRFHMLAHNVDVLQPERSGRLTVLEGDCTAMLLLAGTKETSSSSSSVFSTTATQTSSEAAAPELTSALRDFVLFVDPPWGGLSYKDMGSCALLLGERPVAHFIRDVFATYGSACRAAVVKAPFNVTMTHLNALKGVSISVETVTKKMVCVVLTLREESPMVQSEAKRPRTAINHEGDSLVKTKKKKKKKKKKKTNNNLS